MPLMGRKMKRVHIRFKRDFRILLGNQAAQMNAGATPI
jgi:hypothetical protein